MNGKDDFRFLLQIFSRGAAMNSYSMVTSISFMVYRTVVDTLFWILPVCKQILNLVCTKHHVVAAMLKPFTQSQGNCWHNFDCIPTTLKHVLYSRLKLVWHWAICNANKWFQSFFEREFSRVGLQWYVLHFREICTKYIEST